LNYTYYGIEAAGHLFYACDDNGTAQRCTVVALSQDAPEYSTVFTVFEIDTTPVYGSETDDASPKLTAEMLTVSEDKKKCSFSKKYIDELA